MNRLHFGTIRHEEYDVDVSIESLWPGLISVAAGNGCESGAAHITPAQARELAAILTAAADSFDGTDPRPHRCDDCAVLLDDRGFHCGQAMIAYPAFTSLTIRAEKIANQSTRLWLVEDVMLRRRPGAELHIEGPKGTITIPPSLRIGADVLALVDIVRADNA